jgi:hypothetical protein
MLRALVFLIIAGVGGLLAWSAFQPECQGGSVVSTRQACLALAGFEARDCDQAFERARMQASVYPNRQDCEQAFPVCEERRVAPIGYSPRPVAYCVWKGAGGEGLGQPIFKRAGHDVERR